MKNKRRIQRILMSIFLTLYLFVPEARAFHRMALDVDVEPEKSLITGTVKTDVAPGEEVVFLTGSLGIDEVRLDGEPAAYDSFDGTIKITPRSEGELAITYRGTFKDQGASHGGENPAVPNVIDERGVSLTNLWYPTRGDLSLYDLTARFPSGYTAISEAEEITKVSRNSRVEYHFRFPYPVEGVNLMATDRYEVIRDVFRDIEIYGYFFREDAALAKSYIEFTKKYLAMYEDLIGMYPFRRFSIVENFLPTGYSMPTYTLLGSSVVNLPFIVETSLGHEILHQWFGNYVYIDYESGNWAEGLTTYLADHLYREQEGEGWQYRKQILVDYMSYVDRDRDIPLKYFTGRVDRPSRAMGYGKVAMVFHMLKNRVGSKAFYKSLKNVIAENSFRRTSWNDLKRSFEKISGEDLALFFSQWTEKEGLLELTLYGAELTQVGREFVLHFHIDQEGTEFRVSLPVTIYYNDTLLFDILAIDGMENSFDLTLPAKPHKIVLDEEYDTARSLSSEEFPPVIAGLLGEENIIIAVPSGSEGIYGNMIDEFKRQGAMVKAAGDITIAEIEDSSLILPGIDNPLIKRLYGRIAPEDAGFYIMVKKNPWNREKVAAIVYGRSGQEVDAAFRKISHYGKYSTLLFEKGVNTGSEIQDTKRGVVMNLEHEATAVEVSSIKTLSDVIQGVQDRNIIYVGEVHDVFAHHAVQLDIITGIYRKNPKIAIGMEMFQRPFQSTLDSFVSGHKGQMTFLKESEYFKRWGFDYRLYKPILDFARTEKIPVIALNLQREIIEKVSSQGIDSLSEEEKKDIPLELDFSDSEYRERLQKVFSIHEHADDGDFNHFYQSQILWDETMANSVAEYLEGNPDRTMIVLAGQGHLRYGSGIPKRAFRRTGRTYGTVLIDEEVEKGIADYVVFPKPVEGITTPKLMAFLSLDDGRMKIAGFPDNSVAEQAGLEVDDIILFIDDVEINSIDDIRIYLLNKQIGDIIRVRVLRLEEGRKREREFDVAL